MASFISLARVLRRLDRERAGVMGSVMGSGLTFQHHPPVRCSCFLPARLTVMWSALKNTTILGDAPAEPKYPLNTRLGRSLALPVQCLKAIVASRPGNIRSGRSLFIKFPLLPLRTSISPFIRHGESARGNFRGPHHVAGAFRARSLDGGAFFIPGKWGRSTSIRPRTPVAVADRIRFTCAGYGNAGRLSCRNGLNSRYRPRWYAARSDTRWWWGVC